MNIGVKEINEKQIKENADKLIALGKEAWLKKRKAKYKKKMTDEQQESTLHEIELEKENEILNV